MREKRRLRAESPMTQKNAREKHKKYTEPDREHNTNFHFEVATLHLF